MLILSRNFTRDARTAASQPFIREEENTVLSRKARRELSNSKREATISILARVKKTELLKSRSSLTNHGRMQRGCELVSRFIPRRVPQRFLEAEDIKRRNTLSPGIYRSINLPTVLEDFIGWNRTRRSETVSLFARFVSF